MHTNPVPPSGSGASAVHVSQPPMTPRLFFWAITSALAGFLFGFDTVVISGAEKTIQSLWHLSAGMHGVALGAALYGTVLGSMFGGWPTDRFGRKATLFSIGVLYVISAVGCGFAWDVYSFIVARFIGGVGIGVSTVAAPLVHFRDCPGGASRTADGDVPVQHRLWHHRGVCVQRAAQRHRRERLALDARRGGVSFGHLYASCVWRCRKAPAGCSRARATAPGDCACSR